MNSGGRTIIFTETKNDASELAGLMPTVSRALHGDIAQAQREVHTHTYTHIYILYICICVYLHIQTQPASQPLLLLSS
jgi:hypothetical protein